jgi:hypothetical protein
MTLSTACKQEEGWKARRHGEVTEVIAVSVVSEGVIVEVNGKTYLLQLPNPRRLPQPPLPPLKHPH